MFRQASHPDPETTVAKNKRKLGDDKPHDLENGQPQTKKRRTQSTSATPDSPRSRLAKNPIPPEETLLEKVNNIVQKKIIPAPATSLFSRIFSFFASRNDERNYDQHIIVEKINAAQRFRKKRQTQKDGYCNGLTLLWLTMRRLRLTPLFDHMLRQIGDCDDDHISSITKIATVFLDLIERGQAPEEYFSDKLSQDDVDWITGIPRVVNTIKTKAITTDELAVLLQPYSVPDTMVCVTTWLPVANEKSAEKPRITKDGHIIGIYFDHQAELYNSNYRSGQPFITDNLRSLAQEIHRCSFTLFHAPFREKREYEIDVLRLDAVTHEVNSTNPSNGIYKKF